jgi:hypothetical protein
MKNYAFMAFITVAAMSCGANALTISDFHIEGSGPHPPNSTLAAVLVIDDINEEYLVNYYISSNEGEMLTENYSLATNNSMNTLQLTIPESAKGGLYYLTAMIVRFNDSSIIYSNFEVAGQDSITHSFPFMALLLIIAVSAAVLFKKRKRMRFWK